MNLRVFIVLIVTHQAIIKRRVKNETAVTADVHRQSTPTNSSCFLSPSHQQILVYGDGITLQK